MSLVEPKETPAKNKALFGSKVIDKSTTAADFMGPVKLSIDRAKEMIKLYKDRPNANKPVFIEERTLKPVKAFAIDSTVLEEIRVKFPNYTGIRLYLAIKGFTTGMDPIYTLVIVPKGEEHMDNKDKNILENEYLYDWIEPCPSNCPDDDTELDK